MTWPLKLKSGSRRRWPKVTITKTNPSAMRASRIRNPRMSNAPPHKLDHRNRDADEPERPDWQKRVRKGQEIFSSVLNQAELKDLPDAGHEKDQAENEPREEQSPRAIKLTGHDPTSAGIYLVCTSDFGAGAAVFSGADDGAATARLLKTCRYCALFSFQ